MKRKAMMLGMLLAGTLALGAAETVLAITEAKQLPGKMEPSESGAFCRKGRFTVYSRPTFKVDPAATYVVSGEFRATEDGDKVTLFYGFAPLNAAKKRIVGSNCMTVAKTSIGELAEAAAKGAETLKIRNAGNWKASPRYLVAFHAAADGSDIPNFNLSPVMKKDGIAKLENGDIEVSLSKPLAADYPAGTKVRLHISNGGLLYCAASRKTLTDEWQAFSGKVSGIAPQGNKLDQWRPGTVAAQLVLINTAKVGTVEFRNLKVEKE